MTGHLPPGSIAGARRLARRDPAWNLAWRTYLEPARPGETFDESMTRKQAAFDEMTAIDHHYLRTLGGRL